MVVLSGAGRQIPDSAPDSYWSGAPRAETGMPHEDNKGVVWKFPLGTSCCVHISPRPPTHNPTNPIKIAYKNIRLGILFKQGWGGGQ